MCARSGFDLKNSLLATGWLPAPASACHFAGLPAPAHRPCPVARCAAIRACAWSMPRSCRASSAATPTRQPSWWRKKRWICCGRRCGRKRQVGRQRAVRARPPWSLPAAVENARYASGLKACPADQVRCAGDQAGVCSGTFLCVFLVCDRALPAADFDASLLRPSRSTLEAAVAACAGCTSAGGQKEFKLAQGLEKIQENPFFEQKHAHRHCAKWRTVANSAGFEKRSLSRIRNFF